MLIYYFLNSDDLSACNMKADLTEICEASSTICEAVFNTNGDTCEDYCQSLGRTCNEGWNVDGHTCNGKLESTEDSSRTGNGCNESYNYQICRCEACKLFLILFQNSLYY